MTKLYDGMGNDVTDQYIHKSEIPKTAVKNTVDENIKSKKPKTKVVKP